MPPKKRKQRDLNVYSFSKLDTYVKCSEMFKLQYVDKVSGVDTSSLETVVGNKCHDALEEFYLNSDIPDPYTALVQLWKDELTKDGLEALATDLNHYASDISKLFLRAGANYKGADPIRTSTGQVPKSPEMTTGWKDAVREMKLWERAQRIDKLAAQVQPRKWIGISLADTYANSCSIMYGYRNPADISEVLLVEMPLSELRWVADDPNNPGQILMDDSNNRMETVRGRGPYKLWMDKSGDPELVDIDNKVVFPRLDSDLKDFVRDPKTGEIEYSDDTTMFNGYIDLVCRTRDGKLAIIDHKTSKGEPPTMAKVARHQQLLLYGWAIWRLTGEVPDLIGINHLRTNKLVLAKFNLDLALEVLKAKLQTIRGIDNKVHIKQDPYGYGSMCITQSSKGEKYCPYFHLCHKDLVPQLT